MAQPRLYGDSREHFEFVAGGSRVHGVLPLATMAVCVQHPGGHKFLPPHNPGGVEGLAA